MSNQRTESLLCDTDFLDSLGKLVVGVAVLVGVGHGVDVGGGRGVVAGVVVVGSLLSSTVVVLGFVGVLEEVIRSRGSQVPASRHTVLHLANPRSLRWLRGLLPADEGTVWLAEVTSLLAATTDKSVRRLYVRSYRRKVPQLIWTSWTEHPSVSRRRELL